MNVLSLHCTVDPYVIAGDDDDDVQAYVCVTDVGYDACTVRLLRFTVR